MILSIITHLDTLLNFKKSSDYDFAILNENFHVDLEKLKKSNVKILVLAIFISDQKNLEKFDNLNQTIKLIDTFYNRVLSNSEIRLIKDYNDMVNLYKDNKIGVILALEGAGSIYNLAILRVFYHLGIRMISLTWNNRNQLADGAAIIRENKELSSLGRRVIEEIVDLKIILDISHLSSYNFWEIINNWQIPVIASHSNVKTISNHPRNLEDKQLQVIKNRAGLIGINFYPPFLYNKNINSNHNQKTEKVDINTVIQHIDYIKQLVGLDCICLGTDFDGIEITPVGLENISKLANLEKALRKKNYTEKEIKKIFHDNALFFLKRYWG